MAGIAHCATVRLERTAAGRIEMSPLAVLDDHVGRRQIFSCTIAALPLDRARELRLSALNADKFLQT